MTPDQLLTSTPQKQSLSPKRFDPRTATPFVNKSVSEETRLAYRRAVSDFFHFVGGKHPTEVVPDDVLRWRGHLRSHRKRAATVSFKLSVIRSFFEYLKAAGIVALNPASTKLVPPPELPTEPSGRALTSKEVRYLLTGPDRSKPDGARDYALMLVMLRLSLRVAEVCALRASSVKWSHGRWTLRCNRELVARTPFGYYFLYGPREYPSVKTLVVPATTILGIIDAMAVSGQKNKNVRYEDIRHSARSLADFMMYDFIGCWVGDLNTEVISMAEGGVTVRPAARHLVMVTIVRSRELQ